MAICFASINSGNAPYFWPVSHICQRSKQQNLQLFPGKLIKQTAEKSIRGKSRKYMRGQMLKILAGHMMNHHMVAAAGGVQRPPHIMWPASIFSIGLRMYFLLLPHIVFSAFGPYCIFCPVFYQLPCTAASVRGKVIGNKRRVDE